MISGERGEDGRADTRAPVEAVRRALKELGSRRLGSRGGRRGQGGGVHEHMTRGVVLETRIAR
jgi:hypothetical protein